MAVLVLGLNYKGVPLDVLERYAIGEHDLPKELSRARAAEAIAEAVILSTCNRIEIYAGTDSPAEALTALTEFLSGFHEVSLDRERLYVLEEDDAVSHLFAVAAGIDSMVVGEPQILTQVRRAFRTAQEHDAVRATLSALFRHAIRAGRRARAETDIARSSTTLARAAATRARETLGSLSDRTVLVVGAGKMSDASAISLADEAATVLIANRTHERAQAIAARTGGEAVSMNTLARAIARADLVITSTGSAEPLISRSAVEHAMQARANRPLVIVDLAVPRDVEASAGTITGVRLLDIDDLREIVAPDPGQLTEIEGVRAILDEEAERFASWRRSRTLAPLLEAMMARGESIRGTELERATAALLDLTEQQRNAVHALTRAIVARLLDDPISTIEALAGSAEGDALALALRRLYGLPEV